MHDLIHLRLLASPTFLVRCIKNGFISSPDKMCFVSCMWRVPFLPWTLRNLESRIVRLELLTIMPHPSDEYEDGEDVVDRLEDEAWYDSIYPLGGEGEGVEDRIDEDVMGHDVDGQ